MRFSKSEFSKGFLSFAIAASGHRRISKTRKTPLPLLGERAGVRGKERSKHQCACLLTPLVLGACRVDLFLGDTGCWLGEPAESSLQNRSGRFGWLGLVPPHPYPLPQGEGAPHSAPRGVEALWIGASAAGDSPQGRGPAWAFGHPSKPARCFYENSPVSL